MDLEIITYDFIDALRGWAILGVIIFHTSLMWSRPSSNIFHEFAMRGEKGVQLFYLMSALTLFLSMSARIKKELRPIINFFIRRFFRIAPLFYFAMAVNLAVFGLSSRYWAPDGVEWWYIPLTALFMNGWMPQTINTVVEGGWSIAVEMIFYAMVPYLFLKLKDIKRTLLFILCSLILAKLSADLLVQYLSPIYPGPKQYLVSGFTHFWMLSQAPLFGFGILAYHIIKKYPSRDTKLGTGLLAAALGLFAVHAVFSGSFVPWQLIFGIIYCCMAVSLHFFPNKLMVNWATRWIGKLSFSLYLSNILVVTVLRNMLADYEFVGNAGFVLAFVMVLSISIAVSFAAYRLVELPGIRLGKRVIQKIEQRAAVTAYSASPTVS